jgi:hypothetical protein
MMQACDGRIGLDVTVIIAPAWSMTSRRNCSPSPGQRGCHGEV